MEHRLFIGTRALGAVVFLSVVALGSAPARADGDLSVVQHIIIAMQENHSFDNYFGALPYVKGHKYHSAKVPKGGTIPVCKETDHKCVNGLTCKVKKGVYTCTNSNPDRNGQQIAAFHNSNYCVGPDLDHSWSGSHKEANYSDPAGASASSPNDGFVRVNFEGDQDQDQNETMGFYTNDDLPFYYGLANTFAISDSYYCSLLGQTMPNRQYLFAATSFGHLTTSEILVGPPSPYYKPITGTVFDLMADNGVTWATYYSDPLKYSLMFNAPSSNQKKVAEFATDAQNGTLPDVAFIDPSGLIGGALSDYEINGVKYQTDEHPPNDIRAGQYFIYDMVSALRNSPSWNDSVMIFTYDEHGGYYDHAAPPAAPQGGQDTPDGIHPGQCADNSNPPTSTHPGGGINCSISANQEAAPICPGFTPTGPYPANCPTFNQLGFRVPFIAISPFAKKRYVSHVVADHTSVLKLIEDRFLGGARLTARDANANSIEDMFDFTKARSLKSKIPDAPPPPANDHGCPFPG